MSQQPPIYAQSSFTFLEQQHYYFTEAVQHGAPSSDFSAESAQPPDVDNFNNLVPPVAAATSSNSRSFQSPNEALLPAKSTIIEDTRQPGYTNQLRRVLTAVPRQQVQHLLAHPQARDHFQVQASSSTTTGPSLATTHSQQSANLPSNLLQTIVIPPMPHPAGQGPHAASTAAVEDTSVPVIPSAKSLGKRRQRSDSTTEEPPTKKKASGKAKSMPAKAAQSSSSTSSSSENIPPPDGSGSANLPVATAAAQLQAPKRQTKRKPKAATSQSAEASRSGLSSMQTVFRVTGAGFQPPNHSVTSGQVHCPLANEQQQPPSHLLSGTVTAANEQPEFPQVQTNGSQWALPQSSQQPNSDTPSSSGVQADPVMDESTIRKLALAFEEVKKTVQNILSTILRHAIRTRWVVRRPHPNRSLHFGPPESVKTGEAVVEDENILGRISSNVQTIATQGQMIPQAILGQGSSTPGVQYAADGNYTYTPALQSDANSHQIPHHAGVNFLGSLNSSEYPIGQPVFEAEMAQAGLEAQQAVVDYNSGYHVSATSSDASAIAEQPATFPRSAYDLLSLAWGDIMPQETIAEIAQMQSSSHAPTSEFVSHVEADRDRNAGTATCQVAVTVDQSYGISGMSNNNSSESGETPLVDYARNDGNTHGESNSGDQEATVGPTPINTLNEDQYESFITAFTNGQAFNRELYGHYENDSLTLSFDMFGD